MQLHIWLTARHFEMQTRYRSASYANENERSEQTLLLTQPAVISEYYQTIHSLDQQLNIAVQCLNKASSCSQRWATN